MSTHLVLYLATMPVNQRCPLHTAEVVEMTHPWRQGKAIVFPWSQSKGLVFGVWWRTKQRDEFDDERWISAKQLPNSVEEISQWRSSDAIEEEEAARCT